MSEFSKEINSGDFLGLTQQPNYGQNHVRSIEEVVPGRYKKLCHIKGSEYSLDIQILSKPYLSTYTKHLCIKIEVLTKGFEYETEDFLSDLGIIQIEDNLWNPYYHLERVK